MRHLPLLSILDEVGGLLVQTSLVGGILLAASTALLDAAEQDDGCSDHKDTADGGDDGDLGSLREIAPSVLDAVRLLDLLHDGRFFVIPTLVSCRVAKDKVRHTQA